jgi:hypothetical protein
MRLIREVAGHITHPTGVKINGYHPAKTGAMCPTRT